MARLEVYDSVFNGSDFVPLTIAVDAECNFVCK